MRVYSPKYFIIKFPSSAFPARFSCMDSIVEKVGDGGGESVKHFLE
jgi:hypothetical protein